MSERTQRMLGILLFSLLLLWGGFSLLRYLSVPVHQLALLSGADRTDIAQACEGAGTLCQGFHALAPFIVQTLRWAQPFLWYGVASLALFMIVVGWQFFQHGEWLLRFRIRPWSLLLLFLGLLWIVFNVIALGKDDGQPMRRVIEPVPGLYQNASGETLSVLQESFRDLQARGCLAYVGRAQIGAQVFDMRLSCIQISFITRVLSQVILVLFFLFDLLVLGRLLLSLLRVSTRHPVAELVVSFGAGVCGLIAVLWLLAILSVYTTPVGWIVVLTIPLIGFRHARYWIRRFFGVAWEVRGAWYNPMFLLGWLLVGYLALNFLSVVRPFPIGWDDLSRYVNHPRQLVSYGHLIPSIGAFQWEYLTSLGYLLLGYDSVPGITFALMINWTEGLLAVLSVYAFARVFLGPGHGLLSAFLYYVLPLVGHFSFADMKVDNAVFTMGTLSILSFLLALFPMHGEPEGQQERDWRWMLLAGVFGAFAFAMKPTAVMVLAAIATMLFGIMVNAVSFVGVLLLAWAFFTWHDKFNIPVVSQYVYGDPTALSPWLVYGICLGGGLLLFGYGLWRNRAAVIPAFRTFGVFVISILAAMAPWVAYNSFASGRIIPGLVLNPPDRISPIFSMQPTMSPSPDQDVRVLPPELRPDPKHPACTSTSKAEEVDRYWGVGFSKGWRHYLTLPWRTVMNLDSAGYYVTTIPAFLLLPLLFLLPFLWSRRGRPLLWLMLGTIFMIVEWTFFANGILWYGIGMFLGLVVGMEVLIARAPDQWVRWLACLFLTLSIFTAFAMRFWQYDQQVNLYEYPMGKISAKAIRQRTIPHYDLIRDIVLQRHDAMPDRPYVYRVGTFIPYFIPRSLEYLPMTDNQLDFFHCLHQERDPALTLQRMKALGFSSIIFDTNTHTIEKNPNGTLHKKVQMFVDFLNTPSLSLQVLVNDPAAGVAFVLIP